MFLIVQNVAVCTTVHINCFRQAGEEVTNFWLLDILDSKHFLMEFTSEENTMSKQKICGSSHDLRHLFICWRWYCSRESLKIIQRKQRENNVRCWDRETRFTYWCSEKRRNYAMHHRREKKMHLRRPSARGLGTKCNWILKVAFIRQE